MVEIVPTTCSAPLVLQGGEGEDEKYWKAMLHAVHVQVSGSFNQQIDQLM